MTMQYLPIKCPELNKKRNAAPLEILLGIDSNTSHLISIGCNEYNEGWCSSGHRSECYVCIYADMQRLVNPNKSKQSKE